MIFLEWVKIHRGGARDGGAVGQVPFQANVELLRLFLTHREDIRDDDSRLLLLAADAVAGSQRSHALRASEHAPLG
jgi:hypothetical protein